MELRQPLQHHPGGLQVVKVVVEVEVEVEVPGFPSAHHCLLVVVTTEVLIAMVADDMVQVTRRHRASDGDLPLHLHHYGEGGVHGGGVQGGRGATGVVHAGEQVPGSGGQTSNSFSQLTSCSNGDT